MLNFVLVLVCYLVAIVHGYHVQSNKDLKIQRKTFLHDASDELFENCIQELRYERKLFMRVSLTPIINDHEKDKVFLYCIYKTSGVINDDDTYNKSAIFSLGIENENEEELSKAIDDCAKENGTSKADTVWRFTECLNEEYYGAKLNKTDDNLENCIAKTGVDIAQLHKLKNGDFSVENNKLKETLFCKYRQMGVMSRHGIIYREKLFNEALYKENDLIAFNKYKKCIDAEIGTKYEKAWNLMKCSYNFQKTIETITTISYK